jgi:hypothetical protein
MEDFSFYWDTEVKKAAIKCVDLDFIHLVTNLNKKV